MTDTSLKVCVVYSMLMTMSYIYLYLINNKSIQNMVLGSKSKIDDVIL